MDNFLEFERPIEELSAKIDELERVSQAQNIDLGNEISRLEGQRQRVTQDIFSSLDPWQITQLARHPMRPYTLDYVDLTFDSFQELHGDRMFADDRSIVAGIGQIDQWNVALIGHQKGRDTREKLERIINKHVPNEKIYFDKFGLDYKKLSFAKKNAFVMHPGPMNREIEIES